ncbi:hypothetical protein, partial [Lactobacillus kitasatonis]|uniref:hypothetical protein n=1 Tax=Lactobacillus kitasatonis TaxID=237446 RepID=UPI000555473E
STVQATTNDAGNLTYPALPAAGGHFTKPSDSKDAIYVNPSELSSQGIAKALKNALVKANKLSTALDVTDVQNVGTNNYSFKLKTNHLWGGLTEDQRKTIIQGNYSTRQMPTSNDAGTELAGTWYVTITTEPVKAEVAERIKDGAFFEANDENAYANGQNYYANAEDSNFSAKTSLSDLKKRIMKVVSLNNAGMTSEKAYDTYVWGHATTDDNLIGQLTRQGISVSADKTFDPAGKAFHIVVSTNGLPDITVHFQNTGYVDQDAPVLLADYSNVEGSVDANKVNNHVRPRNLSAVVDANGYVRPLIIRQHDDGTFQPTEWFSAWNSNKSKAFISITATDNNVDWTKPGLYSVTISATNAAGKTSKAVVPVIVSAKNGNVMTVVKNTNLYTEQNGAMVQANLVSYQEVVNPGHQLVVYGAPVTKKLNGQDVQMYRVFGPNENFWVPADALKN